jgi:hypothetical protein
MNKLGNFQKHLLLVFALLTFASIAFGQELAATNVSSPLPSRPESRQISSLHSQNMANGSRVTLTFNQAVSDYGAYRNGDKFTLLIPDVELALSEISVKGTGFSNSKVQVRGANLAISFQLDPNVAAGVTQTGNNLEVIFTNARLVAEAGVNVESTPGIAAPAEPTRTAPESTTPPTANTAAPATPIEGTGSTNDNITQRQADLSVPESPAFTVLGVTPETVVRPTTPREFATSLLNGVDERGNFQTGLALDFVPFLTFFGDQTSLFSYRHSRTERFLARTQVSFATTKGTTDEDKATRLALGLRVTLFDKGDPRVDKDLDQCYTDALKDKRLTVDLIATPGEQPDAKQLRLQKRKEVLGEVVKSCNDDARKRNWNASGWIVGAAPSWISESGETKNYHWNGGGVWTSLAYGFENVSALKNNSQLILHARYRNNEVVPDPNNAGKFLSQDSVFFGGRLRVAPGIAAKSIFSLEGNFVRSRANKGVFDNSSRFSLGFERRVADNIWFQLALGGQSGRADGRNNAFVLSSFKWGFDQKK